MKRVRRVLITLVVATSVFATSVFAAPSISDLENQKDKAESEVKSLQEELTALLVDINLTEQKLVKKGQEIIKATERLEEAKEDEERQYNNMVKRIKTMYEKGNVNMLEILFESGSFAEMLQNFENVQALHEYDRKELNKYIQVKEEIASLKEKLEKEQDELIVLQTNLESKQKSLNDTIKTKKNQIANLETEIANAYEDAANQTDDDGEKVVIGGRPYKGTGDQSVGNAIVAAARSYIGVWYEWGGNDRNGIDCSGLTKAVHKSVGITIDRWSGHQAIGGKAIGDSKDDLDKARPGDIICYPGHVAIYIGNYRIIHAPRSGKQVCEASVYLGYTKEITAIRRYW